MIHLSQRYDTTVSINCKGGIFILEKFIKTILIILLIIFCLIFTFLIILKNLASKPISNEYFNAVVSGGTLEEKYTSYGEFEIASLEVDSNEERFDKYKIWYPKELANDTDKKYPIVLFVNGTGVPYSKYGAIFEHLASWGFVVIGNDDANSANGESSSITLNYILSLNNNKENIFYNKLDIKHIGISGHSQGGVGAINTVTNFNNSDMFTSIYTASTTSLELANALEWDYDVTKINIPYFMVAGTGKADADTIAPLDSLIKNYDSLNDKVQAVMARRKNIDHGDMLIYADGYMTAWFRYTLMNDRDASGIFKGNSPEIFQNLDNWQDTQTKNLD